MNLTWSINDAQFRRFWQELGEGGRLRLNKAAAQGLLVLCRAHVRREATRNHSSARRLNASPTGHLERVAMVVQTDAERAALAIHSPGFGRVFHPVVITPKRAKALTLPMAAEAYGRRAGELERLGWTLFTLKTLRGMLMGKSKHTGEVKALYALKSRVTLPQDRSLLPSDEAMEQAVRTAIVRRLQSIAKRAQ